jgi:hypothetical protein
MLKRGSFEGFYLRMPSFCVRLEKTRLKVNFANQFLVYRLMVFTSP